VADKAEATLKQLGQRNDIIKTMHRALADHGLAEERGADQKIIRRLVEYGHLSVELGQGRRETNHYRWIIKDPESAHRGERRAADTMRTRLPENETQGSPSSRKGRIHACDHREQSVGLIGLLLHGQMKARELWTCQVICLASPRSRRARIAATPAGNFDMQQMSRALGADGMRAA